MSSPTVAERSVDVLIVGAGPSGLFCANALALGGAKVHILDKRSNKVAAGHADGIQARTIEVFQSYGFADRLLREANQIQTATFYDPGSDGGIVLTKRCPAVPTPTARYPIKATLHQGAIEQIFVDSMNSMDLQVDRPAEPASLHISEDRTMLDDPSSYPIRVVVNRNGSEEVIHTRFLVGADGAHSWVRDTLGIEMIGASTDYVWGVLDLVPDTDFPDIRNWCGIHSHEGSCMIIPREGDKVRLYIQLKGGEQEVFVNGKADKTKTTPEKFLEVVNRILRPYTIAPRDGEFEWWTIYKIGQRVASSFARHNRAFIMGDACHTHSPKAGKSTIPYCQGMNASMNDAHNLAWKLLYVLRGHARLPLLDTYQLERRAYAQNLIDFDKKFASLFSSRPQSEVEEGGVSPEEFIKAYQTFNAFASGIGVHYSPSAIVSSSSDRNTTRLSVGQRMPPEIILRVADGRPTNVQDLLPADTRFKLLLFIGNMGQTSQLARIQRLASDLHVLEKYGTGLFDTIAIAKTRIEEVDLASLPKTLRPHWSKVFTDDLDIFRREGGKAYETYGIDDEGVVVVVRPDGYIGHIGTTFEQAEQELTRYFAGFLTPSPNKHVTNGHGH